MIEYITLSKEEIIQSVLIGIILGLIVTGILYLITKKFGKGKEYVFENLK